MEINFIEYQTIGTYDGKYSFDSEKLIMSKSKIIKCNDNIQFIISKNYTLEPIEYYYGVLDEVIEKLENEYVGFLNSSPYILDDNNENGQRIILDIRNPNNFNLNLYIQCIYDKKNHDFIKKIFDIFHRYDGDDENT
jgi:hypothetical protein